IINGTKLGGISSVLLNYYKNIDRSRVQFDFASLTPDRGPVAAEYEALGATIHFLPTRRAGLRAFAKRLEEILREHHYDVVHAHGCHSSWLDLRVAKRCGVKVRIAHGHNAIKDREPFAVRLKRRVGITLMRHYATVRLACSRDAAIYTFGAHAPKERSVWLLSNAIESARFAFDPTVRREMREALGIKESCFVFGTVGRMTSEKNQIHAVRVLPEVLQRRPDSYLLLVGDGSCRAVIEAEAKALGVTDRVIFTGARSDVPQLLCAMDAFILPSHYEGYPVSAVEAVASGLPVVVSDTVTRELEAMPRITYVSLQQPPSDWAEAICADGGEWERAAGVAAVQAAGFDISAVAAELENLYVELSEKP
ncbi:MAG: glycosyltransferase, partial [Fibrobacter sp.]|nr:glycosyltransferase [Fibrobacter sp.]